MFYVCRHASLYVYMFTTRFTEHKIPRFICITEKKCCLFSYKNSPFVGYILISVVIYVKRPIKMSPKIYEIGAV